MKEYYVDKPAEIEVYTHGGCTDIILRKSIAQESDEDGNMRWTCEERQMRQPGTISAESVKADLWILDWETFIRTRQFCRKRTKPQNGS